MQGKVKWFDTIKGYGFIAGEDGKDYFLHLRQINEESDFPEKGSTMEFQPVMMEKGPAASDAIVISETTEEEDR